MNELLLNNDLTVLNNSLQHYGRLGQKKGIFGASGATRYQNHAIYAKGAPKYISDAHVNDNYEDIFKQALKSSIKNLPNGGMDNIRRLSYLTKRIARARFAEYADRMNDRRMMKSKVNPETGLRLKRSDSSMEEDIKRVNPGYEDFNTNTNNNCILCSAAYEMRRRGYDVAAMKDGGEGYTFGYVNRLFPKADLYLLNRNQNDITTFNKRINDVLRLNTDKGNSRGIVTFEFGKDNAHAMSYEIVNNRITYVDSQRNLTFSEESINKLLRNTMCFYFARLDNVNFDKTTIKEAVR